MAHAHFFEAYTTCHASNTAVHHPLPYGVLEEYYHDAASKVHPNADDAENALPCTWAAAENTAQRAKRLHGRLEILQKQLQHGCVHHSVLQECMHATTADLNVQATPHDTIVADNPQLLQKHLNSMSTLCADLRMRQTTAELVPHFLCWLQNAMIAVYRDRPKSLSSLTRASHDLVMPRRVLKYDENDLEQVLLPSSAAVDIM